MDYYRRTRVGGSSPRVRGKRVIPFGFCGGGRIIPARAGQTNPRRPVHGQNPDHPRACGANSPSPNQEGGALDHPRACGANFHNVLRRNGTPGSSPRVRGKLVLQPLTQLIGRFIPARAGQTPTNTGAPSSNTDHPRACGANVRVLSSSVVQHGSSPRVRGKPGYRLADS